MLSLGGVPLDGLLELVDCSINRTRGRATSAKCSGAPLSMWVCSANGPLAWDVDGRGTWIVFLARTQLNYQEAGGRGYDRIAPPNPNVAEGLPEARHLYMPHIFVPPRFRLRSTALIRGLFRSGAPQPCMWVALVQQGQFPILALWADSFFAPG